MRFAILIACFITLAAAQMPRFQRAQVETRAAGPDLAAQLHSAEQTGTPLWWGYSVPAVSNDRNGCGVAYLEGNEWSGSEAQTPSATAVYEAVLYRLEQGKVDKVRTFSMDCEIDAGGLPVIWLTGVNPDQSVDVLSSLVQSQSLQGNGALDAIAMTAGPKAEHALETFAATPYSDSVRKQSVFWLGANRGHEGFLALERFARGDADEVVRRQITFAFNVSHDPGAVDELIRIAKTDAAPGVRGQALFWLGQKATRQAVGAISDAVANDPDTEVKKRAVFGLSQLPKDQGVPLLIQVAETNSNPAVRKQAMFWLGQSKDPRALAFFEKVLEKP